MSNIQSSLKSMLRKIIPLRASTFEKSNRRLDTRLASLEKNQIEADRKFANLELLLTNQMEALNLVHEEIAKLLTIGQGQLRDNTLSAKTIISKIESVDALIMKQSNNLNSTKTALDRLEGIQKEAIWGEIFDFSTRESSWLKNTTFAPGRWAVGFPFLYVLYRCLDIMKPQNILELGLGQTTKMIGQYASYYQAVNHTVVEHDESWITLFKNESGILDSTSVVRLDLEMRPFPPASHDVRTYQGFRECLGQETYDFIVVDGPFGYGMDELSRVDTLDIIPQSLAPSFVIMFDDYSRSGEQGTIRELKRRLDESKVDYAESIYRGENSFYLLCSKNNSFLCSL